MWSRFNHLTHLCAGLFTLCGAICGCWQRDAARWRRLPDEPNGETTRRGSQRTWERLACRVQSQYTGLIPVYYCLVNQPEVYSTGTML